MSDGARRLEKWTTSPMQLKLKLITSYNMQVSKHSFVYLLTSPYFVDYVRNTLCTPNLRQVYFSKKVSTCTPWVSQHGKQGPKSDDAQPILHHWGLPILFQLMELFYEGLSPRVGSSYQAHSIKPPSQDVDLIWKFSIDHLERKNSYCLHSHPT